MKVVFFGESSADQEAMAVFTQGILGQPLERIDMGLESRGITAILDALDGVFRGIYYRSDAEALVVVVDSDDTDLHNADHDKPGDSGENCRLCKVRKIIAKARQHLRARQGRAGLKVAIGLAVPAIEAWYLVGRNHQVGEAAWRTGLTAGRLPFTRPLLKKEVYGTDRPSLEHETECAVKEAQRIIDDKVIDAIETAFPAGFGSMASEIRSWKAQ